MYSCLAKAFTHQKKLLLLESRKDCQPQCGLYIYFLMPDIPMLYRRTKQSKTILLPMRWLSQLLAICVTVLQSQPYSSIIDVSASICLCSSLILNFYPAKTCMCLTHHALCHGHPTTQVQTHRSSESSLNQNLPQSWLLIPPPQGYYYLHKTLLGLKNNQIFSWNLRSTIHTTSAIVTAYEVKCELCIGLKFPQSI